MVKFACYWSTQAVRKWLLKDHRVELSSSGALSYYDFDNPTRKQVSSQLQDIKTAHVAGRARDRFVRALLVDDRAGSGR